MVSKSQHLGDKLLTMGLRRHFSKEGIQGFLNLGIEVDNYNTVEELREDIARTNIFSLFPEQAYQNRVEHAHSKVLAIRAFIYNIFNYLT